MKTLQLGAGWFREAPGGLERVYAALAEHLPGAGVSVVGGVVGSERVEGESGGRVRAFAPAEAPLWARWRGARRFVRGAMARERPDIVAAHFALYARPVVGLLKGVPLVVHFHGPWASEGAEEGRRLAGLKRALETGVYRRAVRCVVLSEAFGSVLCAEYGVDPARVRVVPGGVDAARFATDMSREAARAELGWPAGRPTALVVRRLARRMGLEGLVEAMTAVRASVPDVLLMIAGKGPLAGELAARVREAGLDDHVRLLGFVPDDALPLAYRAADVSVVPTVALEGFGLITLESLAAGTPVLVTPVGGLPEAVRGLSGALVLDAATPAAISRGLADALTGARPLPPAHACAAYARTHHDWPVIAARVADVYREVLERP